MKDDYLIKIGIVVHDILCLSNEKYELDPTGPKCSARLSKGIDIH